MIHNYDAQETSTGNAQQETYISFDYLDAEIPVNA